MPQKGKKGKKSGKKKKKVLLGNETPAQVVRRLQKTYERNCTASGTLICPVVKAACTDSTDKDTLLTKFLVQPDPIVIRGNIVQEPPKELMDVIPMKDVLPSANQPAVSLEPLLAAIRQEHYIFIKSLYVWDIPLFQEQVASLALLLEKGFYPVEHVELMDCLLQPEPLQTLARAFNPCVSLTTIVLDYNEFGDAGCAAVCRGLAGNRSVTTLSLNYCDLGTESGHLLGNIVASTAVCFLFLDGNNLQCEGAAQLVTLCADQAETETLQREEEAQLKAQEVLQEQQDKKYQLSSKSAASSEDEKKDGNQSPATKQKKKKSKKKTKTKDPPPVGPWIYKLHLADNGIDGLVQQGSFAPLMLMQMFKRLLSHSQCLQELDLEDNLIGDLGGCYILEGLEQRQEAGLQAVKLRTTTRMSSEKFSAIVKLGAGLKKKKGKRKKKKK